MFIDQPGKVKVRVLPTISADDIYAVSLCSTGRGCYHQVTALSQISTCMATLVFWLLFTSLLLTLATLDPQYCQSLRRSQTELLYIIVL